MKLTASSRSLAACLSTVSRAVLAQPTLPILANVLIETEQDGVRMTATTLDLTIRASVEASVQRQGRITVPARLLAEFMASTVDAPCTLTREPRSEVLGVRCGLHRGQFHGIAADDYPPLPVFDSQGASRMEVTAADLHCAIGQTAHATAPATDGRTALTGVALGVDGDHLSLAATDSHRLALRRLPLIADASGPALAEGVIVAGRHLLELARILRRDACAVGIIIDADRRHVRFEVPGIEVTARLIEGQYPQYRQVIPTEASTRVSAHTAELLREVRTTSVLAAEAAHPLQIAVAENAMHLLANTAEIGRDEATVAVDCAGDAAEIFLNAAYVVDALSWMKSDRVTIGLNGRLSPCALRPCDAPDNDYVYVIMPVRVPA